MNTMQWALDHANAHTVHRGDDLLAVIWPDLHNIRKGAFVAWTPAAPDTVTLHPSKGDATFEVCGGTLGVRRCTIRKARRSGAVTA